MTDLKVAQFLNPTVLKICYAWMGARVCSLYLISGWVVGLGNSQSRQEQTAS